MQVIVPLEFKENMINDEELDILSDKVDSNIEVHVK